MSNCKKCKTKKCGCTDKGLTTKPPCAQNTLNCPDPEACSETFSGECIRYTGDTIVDNDIQYGDNFNEIIQKLSLMILNPTCTDITSTCLSTLNVMSTSIGTTSITIKWDTVPTALTFDFKYKLASSLIWTTIPALPTTTLSQVVTGLVTNTDYHFRVDSNCSSGVCFSLTILVKTL